MERKERIQWKQILLTVAVAFGIAVLVNWGVLELFDQKSAEGPRTA